MRLPLLLGILSLLALAPAQAAERPNFVVIIADDVSAEDIGVYGNDRIRTPNIDRLARKSLVFSNAYVTASSCSPSRSSMITSRYPHNLETAAELHGDLPEHIVLFPELLRRSGYFTAHAGKAHFGSAPNRLTGSGLRAFEVGAHTANDDYSRGDRVWIDRLRGRPADRPFFMWFASHDAHRGWDAGSFAGINRPADVIVPPYLADTTETRIDLAHYYDEITRFDYHVGEVIRELERQKVLDNTVVIVLSDNGRPFPHSKLHLYDHGSKTPLIIHWPAGIKGHATIDGLVSTIDLAPTILELAHVPRPDTFQGVSLLPLFSNPESTVRDFIFAEMNWHNFPAHVRMVRFANFVYIRNAWPELMLPGASDTFYNPSADALKALHAKGWLTKAQANIFQKPRPSEEFYNLSNDPLQQENLVTPESAPPELQKLRKVLDRWTLETGDSVPSRPTPANVIVETGVRDRNVVRGEAPGAAAGALQINAPGPIRDL